MKYVFILATAMCVALVSSYPVPEGDRLQSEALDRLVMVEADDEAAQRSKRTIGILRELFPEASQMIEQKVNSIVAEIIRVFGPTLLRGFLGNNNPSGGGDSARPSSDGTSATAASPFDDDDDDTFRSTSSNGSKVSISLPTFPPDEDETTETPAKTTTTTTKTADGGADRTTTDATVSNTVV